MKFKKFVATLSTPLRRSSFKVHLCASSDAVAFKYLKCYGVCNVDFLEDVSDQYPISLSHVSSALSDYGFGQIEIEFICDALERTGVGSFKLPV